MNNGSIAHNNKLEIIGMNLKPIMKWLGVDKKEYKCKYKQDEGGFTRLWEIWEVTEDAWEALDTISKEDERCLVFKNNSWWCLPEVDDVFTEWTEIQYGKCNCEFMVNGKYIELWFLNNIKYKYDNLIEYFYQELEEYNSETIVKMCMIAATRNGINLLELFKGFQKRVAA